MDHFLDCTSRFCIWDCTGYSCPRGGSGAAESWGQTGSSKAGGDSRTGGGAKERPQGELQAHRRGPPWQPQRHPRGTETPWQPRESLRVLKVGAFSWNSAALVGKQATDSVVCRVRWTIYGFIPFKPTSFCFRSMNFADLGIGEEKRLHYIWKIKTSKFWRQI